MFEKEVVSHNIDAQNKVQAKSNSCYLKQNNLAPFNTKQKYLEVLLFFLRFILKPMLSVPSAIPVPTWEEETLPSTRVLLTQLYWLVLAVKWSSKV